MSWIQENKFTAALAGGTLVGSIALIVLASGQSGDYEDAQSALDEALKQERELQEGRPYPTPENVQAYKDNVDDYARVTHALQRDYQRYRPTAEEVQDFQPDQFSNKVSGYRSRLDEAFKANGVELPEGCLYGFEAYSRTFPRPAATGELNYQMKALEWLFSDLAEQKPEALLNVVRPQIAVEARPKKEDRATKRRGAEVDEKIYDVYPLELSFRCSEKSFKHFLEDVASSKEYYFAVNAIRIQNERQTPPNASDAKFPVVTANEPAFDSFDSFAGFDTETVDEGGMTVEEGAEDALSSSENEVESAVIASDADESRLLMQILGDEQINVYLKLDLIVLKQESTKLPTESDEEA
ncbi:Amuc_1100 family pilus-like protein [Rubritalea spongiae]|uniref:Amuc_1100 family pilus-like protein n=1 Tax=Rubritalea spongiae TaxID=430797 RepID=A0ABW5DZA2_9BACT